MVGLVGARFIGLKNPCKVWPCCRNCCDSYRVARFVVSWLVGSLVIARVIGVQIHLVVLRSLSFDLLLRWVVGRYRPACLSVLLSLLPLAIPL